MRSEIMAGMALEELAKLRGSLDQETASLNERLKNSEIKSNDIERKLLAQVKAKETKIAALMKDLAILHHQKDEGEREISKLHSKLATANSAQDQSSELLSENAKEMKSRLDSLVSELNAMTGNLSNELSQVKVATSSNLDRIQIDRQAMKRQLEEVGQQLAEH